MIHVVRVAVVSLLVIATTSLAQEALPTPEPVAVPRFDAPTTRPHTEYEPFVNFRDPIGLMRLGGYLMWPILLCSFLVVTFGLERLVSLRRSRILPGRFLRELSRDLDEGRLDREHAIWRCRTNGSPAALVLLCAFQYWGSPMADIQQSINEGGERELAPLRKNLRALQGTANLATLLGLLGTVIGMILAFNEVAITSGQPRSETLASGIAQALLTTAFGLMVAIPALFLHSYFSGRVERLVYDLDQTALAFAERICESASRHPSGVAGPGGSPRDTLGRTTDGPLPSAAGDSGRSTRVKPPSQG